MNYEAHQPWYAKPLWLSKLQVLCMRRVDHAFPPRSTCNAIAIANLPPETVWNPIMVGRKDRNRCLTGQTNHNDRLGDMTSPSAPLAGSATLSLHGLSARGDNLLLTHSGHSHWSPTHTDLVYTSSESFPSPLLSACCFLLSAPYKTLSHDSQPRAGLAVESQARWARHCNTCRLHTHNPACACRSAVACPQNVAQVEGTLRRSRSTDPSQWVWPSPREDKDR